MKGILLKYNDYTYKISVASAASIVVWPKWNKKL